MIENTLYLATCQAAVSIAADHLAAHQHHVQTITEKLEILRANPDLDAHLVENIDSLQDDFKREEKRLSKALKARLGELLYAEGLTHVR